MADAGITDNNRMRGLIDEILKDPGKISELTKDEISELRKKSNPYGVIVPATKSWVNISITNMRAEYLRRLHMVSLIGYLFRTLEEYEFKPTISELQFLAEIKDETKRKEKEDEMKKEFERDRLGAERFLRRNFDYNPDRHIKMSYTENKEDPERLKRYDEFKRMMHAGMLDKEIKSRLSDSEVVEELKQMILNTYQIIETIKTIIVQLMKTVEDQSLLPHYNKITSLYDEIKPIVNVLSAGDLKSTLAIGLPVDVFYQWDRYLTNHYEDIREVVNILYSEKPDIEYAIQYMDHFDSEEKAKEHRQKWEGTLISSVMTVENGAWSLLGPFKGNRERVEFYNRNTEILKQMLQQVESDHKMGKEFMEKRVKQEKKENILKHGLDDKGLAEYQSAVGTVETLGAKRVLTEEEKRKFIEARQIKDDAEVPDNAIGVDIYYNDKEKGFERKRFFTEAADLQLPTEEEKKKIMESQFGQKLMKKL